MSLVPSTQLAGEIADCAECHPPLVGELSREGLCEIHRQRWNFEACTTTGDREEMAGGYLERLVQRAIASEPGGTGFLSALEAQARALDMVWEAHRRGAAHLPAPVAATLERARSAVPRFLSGAPMRAPSATGTDQVKAR
jgi:hypothetical protein